MKKCWTIYFLLLKQHFILLDFYCIKINYLNGKCITLKYYFLFSIVKDKTQFLAHIVSHIYFETLHLYHPRIPLFSNIIFNEAKLLVNLINLFFSSVAKKLRVWSIYIMHLSGVELVAHIRELSWILEHHAIYTIWSTCCYIKSICTFPQIQHIFGCKFNIMIFIMI